MALTVREVLDLPPVRPGGPVVRAGSDRLDRTVRWVHVSELADVAGTLRGGELVLSVGVLLADPATDRRRLVDSLSDSGAAALMVELGRHLSALPDDLVQAARTRGLPVIELRRPVRFVEVTEVVHARVLHAQYQRLDLSHRAHRTLTPLGTAGAPAAEIVDRCAELTGLPVVLEDLGHRVLAVAGGRTEDVLAHWATRSRQVPTGADPSRGGPERWVAVVVGPRRRRWGRLVVATRVDGDAAEDVLLVLERAAEALTVSRLLAAPDDGAGGTTAGFLQDVRSGVLSDGPAVRARARALGLGTDGPIVVLAARAVTDADGAAPPDFAEVLSRAAQRLRRPVLTGLVEPTLAVVLVEGSGTDTGRPAPPSSDGPDLPERLLAALDPPVVDVLAVARTAHDWTELADALAEAHHIADTVAADPRSRPTRIVVRSRDLGVHSLLGQLAGDPRLLTFVESRLGPLLALAPDRRDASLRTLAAFLDANGVMSAFARTLGVSRASAYGRLHTLERQLGSDLSCAGERTATHLALLAHRPAWTD